MKWLLRILERLRPTFSGEGRLKALKPLFEGVEFFLFAPSTRAGVAPHVRDPVDLKRYMAPVMLAAMPCVLASIYFFGLRMLPIFVVTYAAGLGTEIIFSVVRKDDINEGFFVTGLIYPLIIPPGLPLWAVAVGVVFGVIVGKELFGGTGRNLFNPALVGRCFLALAYPKLLAESYLVPAFGGLGNLTKYVTVDTVDAVTSATPLADAGRGAYRPVLDMLWGNVSGSAGETSALLIIIGGLFLVFTRVANWRTVAGYLGSFAALGALLHVLAPASFGPIGWNMLAGGLLFGAFFMATDPVTCPATNGGKLIFGILVGTLNLLIRNLTGYVEGTMFAILLGNIAAPVIDEVVIRLRLRRLAHEG